MEQLIAQGIDEISKALNGKLMLNYCWLVLAAGRNLGKQPFTVGFSLLYFTKPLMSSRRRHSNGSCLGKDAQVARVLYFRRWLAHSTEPERESKTERYSNFRLLLNLPERVFTLSTHDPQAWSEFPRASLVIIKISYLMSYKFKFLLIFFTYIMLVMQQANIYWA